jgi:hypothetical protein
MKTDLLKKLYEEFIASYDAKEKDGIWKEHSKAFRNFWENKIRKGSPEELSDSDIDAVIKILDKNAKGNKKDSEAVAKVMVSQGTWRKLFHEFASNKPLSALLTHIFTEENEEKKIAAIDKLYRINEGKRNSLTGPSGNVINTLLAAYDPVKNTTMISFKDRIKFFEGFEVEINFDPDNSTDGESFVLSNKLFLDAFHSCGFYDSARTFASFCYSEEALPYWRKKEIIVKENDDLPVTIPEEEEEEEEEIPVQSEKRESIQIQAMLAKMGELMGFSIWLPKADRKNILEEWTPVKQDALLIGLPLEYTSPVMKTIENIDVLWIRNRMIYRAFEVEHTTAIYSGILRMADLLALIPNIDIKLHIVAPVHRMDKVLSEIRRPVFSLLEGKPMSKACTFLSYDAIRELFESENLEFIKNEVLDKYAIKANDTY